MTPQQLTRRENQIFQRLERNTRDRTFAGGRLCRDGVPSPGIYLKEPVRVLFVFREANLNGATKRLDLRDEIRDPFFRPLQGGRREERRPTTWWNARAGMFAHAVAAAIDGKPQSQSFQDFRRTIVEGEWHHDVVNRFAYIQIKKVGGRGTSNAREIARFAERYAETLRAQIDLCRPHLVIGGGTPPGSPAELLNKFVLPSGEKARLRSTGATWWRFGSRSRPRAVLQHWHPARRGSRAELYRDLWTSLREVLQELRLIDL